MKIFIGGDITPTEATVPAYESGDLTALFGTVGQIISCGDLRIANLECALTESDTPIRKCGPNLRGRPAYAQVLRNFGLDAVSLSNNHTFDFGTPGFTDTQKALEQAGIKYTGIGENEQDARRPLYLEAAGKRIALVCVAEHEYSYALPQRCGVWGFDPFETMEDIAIAKNEADYVIVLYHGGKEQCCFPSPRLRRACQAMVRAGADFIACQHSHCIGAYETYRGAGILYGQGNFNFLDSFEDPQWHYGLLVELNDDKNGHLSPTFHPLVTTSTGITMAEGAEREHELNGLNERSHTLLDSKAWLAEWHAFCESKKRMYYNSIASAFKNNDTEIPAQIFPHYLDCEAHTDVWRELYRTWHAEATDELGTY